MIKFWPDSLENPESTYTVVKNFLSPSLCDCTELDKYYKAYSAEAIFQDAHKQNDNKFKNLKLIDEKVNILLKHVCVWRKNLVNTVRYLFRWKVVQNNRFI